jgi:hypothetical protein
MKVKARSYIHDRLFDESQHRGLSVGELYDVVGLSGAYFRVIDDDDRPVLYPKGLFDVVDPTIPADWITITADDVSYIDPPECAEPGFYEDYFDGIEAAVKTFDAFRERSSIGFRLKKG